MDPQAALQVLTEACHELADTNSQRAHRVLQDFREADKPYELLKYAIEHGEPVVQFHAVSALRDAAMREFDHGLTQSEKLSLVEWLLSKSPTVSGLVRRQMSGSMALILKRVWGTLDAPRKEGLLRHVADAGDTELMQAIVVEFNPYTTSAMGVMSWEYHYACKLDLEASFLPQILSWTLECIRGSGPGRGASSLRLLSALLLWDHNTSYIKGTVVELSVRPPENWRGILLSMDVGGGLYGMMEGVRRRVSASIAGDAAATGERQAYLQVINNLASMHGRIFGDERGASDYKVQHVAHMLKLLLPELLAMQQFPEPKDQVAYLKSHPEMLLGACRALSSICATHSLKDVVGALRCLNTQDASISPAAILRTLGDCTVVSLRGSIGNEASEAAEECADIMLDVWTELSSDYNIAAHMGPDLYPQFSSSAGVVFGTYLEKQLYTAAMEAFEDEEDFEGEEEAYVDAVLSGLASVARASHSISLPKLAESLERSKQKLHEAVSKGSDPSVPLEELCWLLKMSSYVMADSGDGETPLVPQIFAECMSAGGINASPLVSMSRTLLNLATDFKASIDTAAASSRLMEELCKALGRWSETYLIPDGDGTGGLSSGIDWNGYIFGLGGEGPSVLNFLVELVHLCFAKFPGDRNLHLIATQNLLKPLTKYSRVHGMLSRTYAWQELYKSYMQESEATTTLEAEVQMHLTSAICNGYVTQAPDCVRELVAWQVKRLCHCASLPKNEFERADRVAFTCNVLSSLRGAARTGCGTSRPLVIGEMRPCIPATLDILGKSKEHTIVYNNVLELAADVFEFHTPYLSDEDSRGLFSWAVELIRRHCADKVLFNAKNGVLTSMTFDNECDALLSIIRLLTQVTNAETLCHDDVASTVFSGVETIMPLLTVDHLKVPPLRRAFFHLLTYMVEAYASKVAELSPQSFVSFLQAIAFGLQVQDDSETGSAVFEAIAAFAKYGVLCRMRGGQALGANEETMIDGKRPLVFLFDSIVSKVIFEDGANSLDMASEPVLYIMAHDVRAFAGHLKAHISPVDAGAVEAINALAVVATSATSSSLDRSSRQGFSAVFKSTIGTLRGLRKK